MPWSALLIVAVLASGCGSPEATPDGEKDTVVAEEVEQDSGAEDIVDTKKTYTGKCAGGPTMCDDGNPCTADTCDPFTGCANTVKTCTDDDPCTIDLCDITTGKCRHDKQTCDDNNICTVNLCKDGVGCIVESTLDCEDGDKCTADGCSPAKGCVSEPMNCDDGKTCTTDSCDKEKGCVHEGPKGGEKCCEKAADCEDNSPCTQHKCVSGLCQTDEVFGCCKSDADCDDDNSCTTDKCSAATGQCANVYTPAPGCCANDIDCHDGDDCTSDRCVSGKCGYDVLCCKAAKDCDKAGALGLCAAVTCTDAGGCAATPTGGQDCCAPSVASVGFEVADTLKVKLVPASNGSWALNSEAGVAKSGAAALVYSGVSSPIPGGAARARAILDGIELPAAVQSTLRFYVVAQPGPSSPKEILRVRAKTSAGEWHIYQHYAQSGSYQLVSIDVSSFGHRAATRNVQFVFELQPSTKLQPSAQFRIDDVQVISTCQPRACNSDSQCNDNLAASKGTCVAGTCAYQADPEYCESGDHASCDDGDFCTSDYCSINTCKHVAINKCCHNDGECDDKNVCSIDACVNKKCVNKIKPTDGPDGCCATVAECDDANPCTIDACPAMGLPCQHTKTDPTCCIADDECDDSQTCTIDSCKAQKCQHQNECCTTDKDCDDGDDKCTTDKCGGGGKCSWTPTGADGCCEKAQLSASFEGKALHGFTLSSSLSTSKWQPVVGSKSFDGKGALYYGNLAKGNYDDGQSKGSVTSPELTIAAKEQTRLRFALYMDTETSTTYDKLEVKIVADGKEHKVWDKKATGFKTKAWVEYSVDLSAFAGKSVKIVFEFDTTDGVANSTEGVYLDAIALDRSCADFSCNTPKDCDDGHAFSKDSCVSSICSYSF